MNINKLLSIPKSLYFNLSAFPLKTAIKKFESAVAANNVEEAKALFVKAAKSLDMAAQKGTVHKNMAARKKSRLAAKLNAMA